ncbi:tetratricopeptide repeat protein [Salinibacter sp. 10B]|uniref:tetratricopeptide repeat protein n=1 Tax=Salinibacter sp. 10B TaxID=1923971 RepID=UPI000CF529AA|nr:tetratricopeptide repeat protein [Salinibacter sp. 10B]
MVQNLGLLSFFSIPTPGLFRYGASLLVVLLAVGPLDRVVQAQPQDSTQLRRFRMADSYLRAGEHEKAIGLLESLYAQSPDNASFYRKLKDAYESVKRYEDAVRLVEDRIEANPSPHLIAEKGRLLYQKGDEQGAEQAWTAAIESAPERASTYRIVYQALVDIRRFRRAIEVLQRARERLDDNGLFRTELAYLYGLDGQHGKAMKEYVTLLAESPNRLALVRNRLQTFVEQGEGISSSVDVLQDAVEEHPLNPAYRELLAWFYMKEDNYAAAYDVYRALDRLQQQQGESLYRFAQKAADADAFDVATTAFEAILERHSDAPIAPDAQRALGATYERWAESEGDGAAPDSTARYDAARAAYKTFLENYPTHNASPSVRATLGNLQLDVYRHLDAAQRTLKDVVSSHPEHAAANEARYDLGRVALLRDNLDRARLLFSRLSERLRSGDLADQARFELALLQYYQGSFEAARTQAEATSANTSADVTNDAIDLSVLIQENKGPDSLNTPLRQYARAQLDIRQHHYQKADARLDSLLQHYGRHSLADDARFRQAEVALAQGDTTTALQHYRTLPQRHPRSPFADRSLFRLGTLYEAQGNPEQAAKLYDRLLTEYPSSLLASDVRTRLRALRRPQG